MKILIIGSGAREHAIAWKVLQNKTVKKIYCAPGNGGTASIAENVPIGSEDIDALLKFALDNSIDLTIVGPEAPLVAGIADRFCTFGLKVFGPKREAASLEGSKVVAKRFMSKYNIPSAKFDVYTNAELLLSALADYHYPLVIKADGLAAGKGVLICQGVDEAKTAIKQIMFDKAFGDAGNQVIVEEYLEGIEASLLCFVDGKQIIPMESARDYKKAYDNDQGPNTGGMGTFSPNPIFTPALEAIIKEKVLNPTIEGIINEEMDFKGILFIGLMIKGNEVNVLEYNVRLGDPETEVILPRLESDLLDLMLKTIDGTLKPDDLKWSSKQCLCVIAASGGYPNNYTKGKQITGAEQTNEDTFIFHGGTKLDGENLVTSGGRVLAVTALADSLDEARTKVYSRLSKVNFDGMIYRSDIGKI